MLSDNIRNYRKSNNMSQDELAEKLGVSRQSVSLWENGQTQPTVDNIIAMTKIFNVSFDMLLDDGVSDNKTASVSECSCDAENAMPSESLSRKEKLLSIIKNKKRVIIAVAAVVGVAVAVTVISSIIWLNVHSDVGTSDDLNSDETEKTVDCSETSSESISEIHTSDDTESAEETVQSEVSTHIDEESTEPVESVVEVNTEPYVNAEPEITEPPVQNSEPVVNWAPVTEDVPNTVAVETTAITVRETESSSAPAEVPPKATFDLFEYCKNFAIKIGTLNGDYCIYQQPSTKYGGYENEYFSISYWADSDKVEFCLHCPLDDVLGINFCLRMRGGYDGKYEYASSKYYRSNGESLRFATGYIDPTVFSDSYPISCDSYIGDTSGQDSFMEESRVGICDLIRLMKQFAVTEGMECDFSAFGFVNF